MSEERVQKILAKAGLGSRRKSEEFIRAGRVTVNGKVAKLGEKADSQKDVVRLDGREIVVTNKFKYYALNKPRGVLCSTKSQGGRKIVLDLIPNSSGLYPVGRLDIDSEGLVLLTNDGQLTDLLTHPRYQHEKEYSVLVARHPDKAQLNAWRRGVVLEDGHKTAPAEVEKVRTKGKGTWLRIIMREGRKRQIRLTGSQIGLPVAKLIRTRISSLHLGNLKTRQWRELTTKEIDQLKKSNISHPKKKQ